MFVKFVKDNTLLEYENLDDLNANVPAKIYALPTSFYGTGHVVYQGSFFYQAYNTDRLLRYDLHLKRVVAEISLQLPTNDTNEQSCRVYSDHREHVGCVDFNVDENGVWVVYRNGTRTNIFVSKLNVDDMSIQKTIVIKFVSSSSPPPPPSSSSAGRYRFMARNRRNEAHLDQPPPSPTANPVANSLSEKTRYETFLLDRGLDEILNGFIICGKIYFLQYHGSQNTIIRLMFDLYNWENKFSYLQSIEFIQPYKKNTQLTYNPYDQKLYAWDSEHLITYSLELI